MRILHISQPVDAGVPRVVLGLAADQLGRGHDVHVACPPGPGLAERATALGATHHAWAAEREPGPSALGETARLAGVVRRVRPDVVVLHSAKAGLAGRLLPPGVLRGARVAYVPHAWSFEAVTGRVAAMATHWEVLAGRRTDVVVCVSADERTRGRAVGVGARMEVVPNGVDLGRRPGDRAAARATLDLGDGPLVVTVGRLARQKGIDRLLDLWPDVRREVPGARLVVVGDGPDAADLHARAGDGVTFTGARDDVDTHLAAADVVALPSRWESTPLVGLEAMAAGRAVVAFEVDGVAAALGDAGVVLDQGDTAGFATALAGLLTDPGRAAAQGVAARERVERVGDLAASVARWDAILTGLVEGRTPYDPEDRPSRRPLDELPVTALATQVTAGAFAVPDVAVLGGDRPGDRLRARVLTALGVPVRVGGEGAGPATVGRAGAGSRLPLPPVSVVATVLNEGPHLERLCDQVLAQLREDDELLIVDGGSTDGSVEGLLAHRGDDDRLRVEVVPGAGISAGRNIGIGKASHEVVVVTDVGCEPAPGFVDAFRDAFAADPQPVLVSGVYYATARNPMERAQALACYPQPSEAVRASLFVKAYTRVFGTGFDPRFAVGRCVGFTRTASREVGGFPEHLATGEDVSFGLAVAKLGPVVTAADAVVAWHQRDGLRATWKMYRGYGRSSTDGGDPALFVRDAVRGAAYVVAPFLLAGRRGRRLALLGGSAYLSLPVARALRADAGPAAIALLPVALATKDLGKLAGALQGLARRRKRAA